jgi:hypothetical protein
LDSIILAIKDLELLLTDEELFEEHKRALQDKFDERKKYFCHIVEEYQVAIERMSKANYLDQCLQQAIVFKGKYLDIVNRHLPVVYCVRVEPKLFETVDGRDWHDVAKFDRE